MPFHFECQSIWNLRFSPEQLKPNYKQKLVNKVQNVIKSNSNDIQTCTNIPMSRAHLFVYFVFRVFCSFARNHILHPKIEHQQLHQMNGRFVQFAHRVSNYDMNLKCSTSNNIAAAKGYVFISQSLCLSLSISFALSRSHDLGLLFPTSCIKDIAEIPSAGLLSFNFN